MTSASDDLPRTALPPVNLQPDAIDASSRRRQTRRVQAFIVVALACGGVLGAVSRYALSLAIPTETDRFPWGTFLENVSGSLVLGFLLIMLLEQFPHGRLARPVLGTGFLGAYTTFSTFMVDADLLIRNGRPTDAAAYLAGSVVGGLLAAWLGMTAARLVIRVERWLQREVA